MLRLNGKFISRLPPRELPVFFSPLLLSKSACAPHSFRCVWQWRPRGDGSRLKLHVFSTYFQQNQQLADSFYGSLTGNCVLLFPSLAVLVIKPRGLQSCWKQVESKSRNSFHQLPRERLCLLLLEVYSGKKDRKENSLWSVRSTLAFPPPWHIDV